MQAERILATQTKIVVEDILINHFSECSTGSSACDSTHDQTADDSTDHAAYRRTYRAKHCAYHSAEARTINGSDYTTDRTDNGASRPSCFFSCVPSIDIFRLTFGTLQ
jgi:hypothetical protein